jgi:hypothetical protein
MNGDVRLLMHITVQQDGEGAVRRAVLRARRAGRLVVE